MAENRKGETAALHSPQWARQFCLASLWELWSKGEKPVETCTILTTDANQLMAPLHDRMPVIIAPKDYDLWLDAAVQEPERLQPLLRPYSAAEMEAYPVSKHAGQQPEEQFAGVR